MRRISLVLAMVASVLVTTASMQAASLRPLHRSELTGMVTKMDRLGHVKAATGSFIHRDIRLRPAQRENAPPQQSADTLALPSSAYSPAVINSQYNYTESVADADGNWFRQNHTQGDAGKYENFGFVFGYYQRADLSSTNPVTSFRYQGMYSNSVAGAQKAQSDGIAYTQGATGASAKSCSKDSTLGCQYITYTYTSNGVGMTEEYDILQYKSCLAEITGTVPTASQTTIANQFNAIMNNLDQAAVTAMANTCSPSAPASPTPVVVVPTPTPPSTPTVFHVVSVRFEKNGSKDDFELKNPPLTQANVGSKVRASVYVNVASLGAPSVTMTRTWSLKLDGKPFTTLSSKPEEITDTDTYHYYFDNIVLSKPGTYTLSVTVQMGNSTDSDKATLKAVKNYKARKISFSFTKLNLQTKTIRAGQQVTAKVDFTVKHLKGHTTGFITRTVLAKINDKWKGVSTNSNSTVVLNGVNHNTVSTQLNAPGSFKIQVTVTVGARSQTKTATITVTR